MKSRSPFRRTMTEVMQCNVGQQCLAQWHAGRCQQHSQMPLALPVQYKNHPTHRLCPRADTAYHMQAAAMSALFTSQRCSQKQSCTKILWLLLPVVMHTRHCQMFANQPGMTCETSRS
jgi:hypothetical protein